MQGEVLEKINYSAVGETVYQTVLANGLRVFLLPKNDFNETYGIISTNFGSVDTEIVSRETKRGPRHHRMRASERGDMVA